MQLSKPFLLSPIRKLFSNQVPTDDISSNKNNLSPKKSSVKLTKFCPTTTLQQLLSVESLRSLDETSTKLVASLPLNTKRTIIHKREKEPLNPTLFEIVNDYNEFSDLFLKHITSEMAGDPDGLIKKINSLSAMLLRIRRFRLKLFAILFLHNLMQFANAAIVTKIFDLLNELRSRRVNLNFNNRPSSTGPTITTDSTLNLVTKALTKAEVSVKELLSPLISCHNLMVSKNIFTGSFMQAVIHDIAPKGFDGVQGDYYYIFHLLALPEPFAAFNEAQKVQWNSYFNELNYLFHFYTLSDIRIDFSVFINHHQHLINLPYSTFMQQTSVSKNTFSRLIHALNDFVIVAWSQLILQRHYHIFTKPSEAPKE